MGIKSLQVILRDTVEGGPGVFFSGSTITGVVRISVEGESQAVKGILPLGVVQTNHLLNLTNLCRCPCAMRRAGKGLVDRARAPSNSGLQE